MATILIVLQGEFLTVRTV